MGLDFQAFLRSRRSVRQFTAHDVPVELVDRLLETATFAPSAHHRQPWRFAVVAKSSKRSSLSEAMAMEFRRALEADGLASEEVAARIRKSRDRIESAPVVIVLCLDLSDMDAYPDPTRQQAERTMAVQSVAMAGLQLLLAAHGEGLAGVWSCGPLFAPTMVRATLNLPETWEPQGMLMIGYPVEQPAARPRRPIQEITLLR